MKKNLLVISCILFSINAFCQSKNTLPYYSENGIEIYIDQADCIDNSKGTAIQYLLIELVNNTNQDVTLSFNKEMWFDNVCQTCNSNSDEYKVNLTVNKNSRIKGNCDSSKNSELRIFSKMLNLDKVRKLTKYELKNISVEKIN